MRTARYNLDYIFDEEPGLLDKIPGLALIHR
jgi:GntR family transcriptional regulator of vanillate catabolism